MLPYASYVICGTPRSGSTLLVEMLIATGVAGRPNSYFRRQSIPNWADRWGVDREAGIDSRAFDKRYIPAMLQAGRGDTGLFGLRLMWASAAEATERLLRLQGGTLDLAAQFETAFGPVLYLHLSRDDKVAQAVSLVRAEQSGLWHLAADGTVYEGPPEPRPMVYDAVRLGEVVAELHADDAAWAEFFNSHAIDPLRLTYETMSSAPQSALATILSALGRDPALANSISPMTRKLASGESRDWAERFRRETASAH